MKKLPAVLTLVAAVTLIAAVSSIVSFSLCCRGRMSPKAGGADWIHSQLALTAEETKALEPIDQRYNQRSRVLQEQMRLGNLELAKAILEDGGDSPRVRDAIGKIHTAMGELQHAAINHVFEMREALTPEQYNKLLHFTADALGNLDSEHAGK
jgi:Spy/CpxP family protein refolding chaperone